MLSTMASLCRRFAGFAPAFQRVLSRSTGTASSRSTVFTKDKHLAQVQRKFSSTKPVAKKETVTLNFLIRDEKISTKAIVGDNLLDIIVENDIDVDGFGACEGTLACSTCHLIFKPTDYEKIPEQPTDEELDMLDLAYSLTDTSRLGCQVIVTKEMDGWEISVPAGVADARS